MRCDRFDGFPCLADGKADAHVALRPPGARARRTSRCSRTRASSGSRPTPSGATVTGVVVDRDGVEERYQRRRRRRLLRRGQLGRAAAALGQRAAPARPRELVRRRRAATTWRTSTRASIAISTTPNPTKFQKTLGVNDYYWGADGLRATRSATSRCSASPTGSILRGGAPWFAPGLALDYMAKHAIDFWLTTEDLPHPTTA